MTDMESKVVRGKEKPYFAPERLSNSPIKVANPGKVTSKGKVMLSAGSLLPRSTHVCKPQHVKWIHDDGTCNIKTLCTTPSPGEPINQEVLDELPPERLWGVDEQRLTSALCRLLDDQSASSEACIATSVTRALVQTKGAGLEWVQLLQVLENRAAHIASLELAVEQRQTLLADLDEQRDLNTKYQARCLALEVRLSKTEEDLQEMREEVKSARMRRSHRAGREKLVRERMRGAKEGREAFILSQQELALKEREEMRQRRRRKKIQKEERGDLE